MIVGLPVMRNPARSHPEYGRVCAAHRLAPCISSRNRDRIFIRNSHLAFAARPELRPVCDRWPNAEEPPFLRHSKMSRRHRRCAHQSRTDGAIDRTCKGHRYGGIKHRSLAGSDSTPSEWGASVKMTRLCSGELPHTVGNCLAGDRATWGRTLAMKAEVRNRDIRRKIIKKYIGESPR